MSQMIHYRDDLFLLSLRAKSLEAAFALDADPEFWSDQVLKEVLFLDETIRAVAGLLAENRHLVDRDDYLRLLERLSLDFAEALARFEHGASPLVVSLQEHGPTILGIATGQRFLAKELAEGLAEVESTESGESSIVSGDEIAKLLSEG
ncbi:MAG: hypothetical protein M0001_06230 [Treponema sp.]|nr:hypothetical protein [Treponema sp.]